VLARDAYETTRGGQRTSLEELFDTHASYVWNTLRRLGVPPSDLEDVTHDVFVQVGARLGELDPRRPTRPWLFGFAFRLASQHRRRAFRRYEVYGDADAVDPAGMPDERLSRERDRRLVLDALEAIDLDRRAVFVLSQIDGQPMSEVARVLGIPVNTGYSRLRVARDEFAAAVKRLRPDRGEP
jgi:RNA polymerase sigma-70 factor (ECF subfamily)